MAIKRRASTPAASVAKKPRGVSKQCASVASMVLRAESFSAATLQMLSNSLPNCLGVAKEHRDPFQEKVIQMVGEVLVSIKAGFETRINDAETKLSSANGDKASREHARDATSTACSAKNTAFNAAKAGVEANTQAIQTAKSNLSAAESASKEGNKVQQDSLSKKERLEAALANAFHPLKEGSLKEAKKVKELSSLGKDFQFEASMLSYLPEALSKAPSDRGSFDEMVLKNFEEEMKKQIRVREETLSQSEKAKAELTAKVEAAQAELESAKNNAPPCKEAHDAAKTELNAANAAHKLSTSALQLFEPEMKQVEKDLAQAKNELEAFVAGAQASYDELLNLSSIKPVVEAEPAAAADPPATNAA